MLTLCYCGKQRPEYVIICNMTSSSYSSYGTRNTSLSPPVKYFTDCSKAVLILCIFYVFLPCVCYAFVYVCLLVPCVHLLGKG